jgi:hypothetical protein
MPSNLTHPFLRAFAALMVILTSALTFAQAPPPGVACVVSAGNRNAPLAPDGSYTVFGIPGNLGAIRARASCSDGSVGQSAAGFTNPFQPDTIELGPIVFGSITPVPVAINVSAPQRYLTTGQTGQLTVNAVGANGVQTNVTPRSEGTVYAISNDLMATVTNDGLVRIFPLFASASSARVVASATNEGSVSGTYMFILGPRGKLTGTVTRADGSTAVAGAQVSVLRLQPFEQAGSALTNAAGQFELLEVNAGPFLVSVLDPATEDRALAGALIETEGQTANVALRLNGQGTVNVTVKDAVDAVVPNTVVTMTSLGAYRDTRTLITNAQGVASFAGVAVGDLTVSAREPVTRLVGTGVAKLTVNQTLPITLKLQPVAAIQGVVYDVGGTTLKPGVQVRILSRERGILTQSITGADGAFRFDTLPISDGPYTLDAFLDGRLRARVPGIVLPQPNVTVTRNITLGPVGTITGTVRDASGAVFARARVSAQSLAFLGLTFEVEADAQGRFTVLGMPVGDFELTAVTTTGRNGRATGRIAADNETVNVDIVLADNTLIGTVYLRDGITPAGAGVKVYLAPKSFGTPYTYVGVAGVLEATTNSAGGFGFMLPSAGAYIVQAEQLLERGRTEVIAVNLNASQPLQARVVFLAKGSVSGVVKNSAGQVQANANIVVRTEGAFTAERSTTTNASGQYLLDGVFVGDLIVRASNTVTRLSGFNRGRMNTEGEAVVINVTLQATGTVQGRVIDADGSGIATPVRLTLRVNGTQLASIEAPNGAAFSFELIPIGDIEVAAEQISTGNRGVGTTRLLTAGDIKNIDVRLVGMGTVRVTARDAAGAAVAGAMVSMTTRFPFASSQQKLSDAAGLAEFRVFAGDFDTSASKTLTLGTLAGSASGTLLVNQTLAVPLTMTTAAIGSVNGTVFRPDGTTPVGAGIAVQMTPVAPLFTSNFVLTNALGQYEFPRVIAGTYVVDALRFISPSGCPRDRIRGRAGNVTVATQDQIVTANIQLIGQGQVNGKITDAQGAGVAGIDVTLVNPDPIFGFNSNCDSSGTAYDTVTDSEGNYRYLDVPPGNFTLTAENQQRTLRAEAAARVNFDGDIVTLDLTLTSNAVTMPQTFYDANGFEFDVTGIGSLATGTNSVFAAPAPDNAGMRLEIIQNNIAVPFLNGNGTIGELSQNRQQVTLDEVGPSGLNVSRKILTPRAGYFSRYIETLENKTTAPITVSVRVKSHHRNSNSNPRVVDTSDGDQILSVINPVLRDRWAVVDDQSDADPFVSSSIPATAHLFDGAAASLQVASADYSLIGTTGKLTYQWDNITVAPNSKVSLMHFVLHQLDRQSAREAALRLAMLPPEAINDLTTDERAQIKNFAVPATSTVAPLPNLDAGVLQGKVLSGDGVTPVPGAVVRFKSQHPLFGRIRSITSNLQGLFEFRSTLSGTATNYVIPVDNFTLSATYAISGASSSSSVGQFRTGQTSVTQNIIFNGTGDVRGTVKRHSNALLAGVEMRLCAEDVRRCSPLANYTINAADSSYLMLANRPLNYFVFADKTHPQQAGIQGIGGYREIYGKTQVTVTAGDVVLANIIMEPTGSITGIVRDASNNPLVNGVVSLFLAESPNQTARVTSTDTSGRYRFTDVPLGGVVVRARDSITGAGGQGSNSVSVDIESTLDLQIAAFGGIAVQVKFARGLNAPNSSVDCSGTSPCAGGRTDTNGQILLPVTAGTYQVRAFHPDTLSGLFATASATVTAANEQVPITIIVPAAGSVSGTIVRPDATTLANGFPIDILQLSGNGQYRSSGLRTTATGTYRAKGLGLGTYLITAYDAAQDRYADAEFTVTEDGQEVTLNMTLLDNRIALPATLKDANQFSFDVQRSGALLSGDTVFNNAGVKLEVNGQAYVGETSARLEAARRQFRIAQIAPIYGLQVERKIYVPRGAYFARYLEILKNPTNAPIIASVKLSSTLAGGQVLNTSSGDAIVGNDDRWITVDDSLDEDVRIYDEQLPPSAHVFGALNGSNAPSSVALATGANPVLSAQWNSISVPANGSVTLMHFVALQINRAGVAAAAQRLVSMPPEVLADMTAVERNSIANFAIPADGISAITALPSLTSSVGGIAFEGDVRTPVRSAQITVQSTHPLFNRVWNMRRDPTPLCPFPGTAVASLVSLSTVTPGPQPPALGSFVLQGQLTALDSIALPEGVPVKLTAQEARSCYGKFSGHSFTNVPSRVVTVTPPVVQNVIWDTGVLTGSVIGSADFQVTSGRVYLSVDDPDPEPSQFTPIRNDATYVYPGLLPGNYDLLMDTSHPDAASSDGLRGQRTSVQVTLGQITVTDVQMQPVGKINGTVITANGEASVNARVTLQGLAPSQSYDQCLSCVPETLSKHKGKRGVEREVRTDSLGRYSFAAVPAGAYTITAIDPISDSRNVVSLSVAANQTQVQNIVLMGLGSANLIVTNPAGAAVFDAFVYMTADAIGPERVVGRTNPQGLLTIANIPIGNYQLRVRDPRYPGVVSANRLVSGNIATNGQVNTHQAQLLAYATINVLVIDSDNGGAPVANASVRLTDFTNNTFIRSTNAQGRASFTAIGTGSYRIVAQALIGGNNREETATGTILASQDGQTVPVSIDLRSAVVPLPAYLWDANRSQYDIEADAASADTPRLSIDGVAFTGASTARRELSERQHAVTQATPLSGLRVTRKAFIPINGYFVRYVEVLENSTASPITTTVRVASAVPSYLNLIDTSSGDGVIDASDRWLSLAFSNSAGQDIAYTMVSGGQSAAAAPLLTLDAVSGNTRTATATWAALQIPANQTVELIHFAAKQINRAGGMASAQRLIQLPPEALIGLSNDDVLRVANFALPSSLQSTLPELPSLLGVVTGRVTEGDGTPFLTSSLRLRSANPLFNREWSVGSTENGDFVLTGAILSNQSIAVPTDAPITLMASNTYQPLTVQGSFQSGSTSLTLNAQFPSGQLRGNVLGATAAQAYSGSVAAFFNGTVLGYADVNPQGAYSFRGLVPGSYRLTATIYAGGDGSLVSQPVMLSIPVGAATLQNITLPDNGALKGVLRRADGTPVQSASLWLRQNGQIIRTSSAQALGLFSFNLVPVGSYEVISVDPQVNTMVRANVVIQNGQIATQDLNFPGLGTAAITVKFARGVAAPNVRVYLASTALVGERDLGLSNASGVVNATNVPVGAFTVRTTHPDTQQESTASATMTADGANVNVQIDLKASARLRLTVQDADASNAPIAAARLSYAATGDSGSGPNTDAAGMSLLPIFKQLSYSYRAVAPDGREASGTLNVDASIDGQIVDRNIGVTGSVDQLGTLALGAQTYLYAITLAPGDTFRARIVPAGGSCNVAVGLFETSFNNAYTSANSLFAIETPIYTATQATREYPIVVSSVSNCAPALYRLSVFKNSTQVAPVSYQHSGTLTGRLLQADGITVIPNGQVTARLNNFGTPFVALATSNTNGVFTFSGLPVRIWSYEPQSAYEVNYVKPAGVSVGGSATTNFTVVGATQTQDLILDATTQVNFQLKNPDGSNYVPTQTVNLRINPSFSTVSVPVDALGQASYTYIGNSPAEAMLELRVNGAVTFRTFVIIQPAHAQTISVPIVIAYAALQGVVRDPNGVPIPNIEVEFSRLNPPRDFGRVTTNELGQYFKDDLPAGMTHVEVEDPLNRTFASQDVLAIIGQTVTRDLQLNQRGTITGTITSTAGAPIVAAEIEARFGPQSIRLFSGPNGQYVFTNLPLNSSIQIIASIKNESTGETVQSSATATLTNGAPAGQVNLSLAVPPGSGLILNFAAADGDLVGLGYCEVYVSGETSSGYQYADCDAQVAFYGFPAGVYNIYLNRNVPQRSVTLTANQNTTENYLFSVVRGTLKLSDGSAAQNASVTLTDSEGNSQSTEVRNGIYRIVGAPLGAFTLLAQENGTAIETTGAGNISSLTTPSVVNLVFPASTAVEGVVSTNGGQALGGATVYLQNDSFVRQVLTNIQGRYRFEGLALAPYELVASNALGTNFARTAISPTAPNQLLTVNLALPVTGALAGTVLKENGEPGIDAYGWLTVQPTNEGLGFLKFDIRPSALGRYSAPELAAGDFRLMFSGSTGQNYGHGIANALIASGSATTQDVRIGSADYLSEVWTDVLANHYFVLQSRGEIERATATQSGVNTALNPLTIKVSGKLAPEQALALTITTPRQLGFGPNTLSGLRVSRRIFVPSDAGKGFVRTFDSFYNPTAAPITVPINFSGEAGFANPALITNAASTGSHYVVYAPQPGPVISSTPGTAGYVFAGVGAPVPGALNFVDSQAAHSWQWSLTVPAGGTVSYLSYLVLRDAGSTANTDVQTQAAAIFNMTQAGMFDGLSTAEKASVINFVVPQ